MDVQPHLAEQAAKDPISMTQDVEHQALQMHPYTAREGQMLDGQFLTFLKVRCLVL